MKNELTEKVQSVREAEWAADKAKEDPSFVFPCLVRTFESVSDWPDDVKPDSVTAHEFYTFRITYDTLEKIASMPEVRSLTIR